MIHTKCNKQIVLLATKYPHIFNVQLNLEHQTRFIGKIDTSGDGTFITNRLEKHLFRKFNALGLNYALLADESIKFHQIAISFNGKKLYSTRDYYLKKGKAFQFSNKSFELQLFVPIDELNLGSVKRFEQSNGHQEELFSHVA
ncbi:MAG: hypothetical protein V1720_14820 [bacterium]